MTAETPQELLRRSMIAHQSLQWARERLWKEKSREAAMAFCRAYQEARAARAAVPKPTAV